METFARRPAMMISLRHGSRCILVVTAMIAGGLCFAAPLPSDVFEGQDSVSSLTSERCRTCHQSIFDAWRQSNHAWAQRAVGMRDREAFNPPRIIDTGTDSYVTAWMGGKAAFREVDDKHPHNSYVVRYVIGKLPVQQYLAEVPGGRLQASEMAYDPRHHDWFDVFGSENRKQSDWGNWLNRGMNWNSMCAPCHMTGYRRNYRAATDTYASSWIEPGVGCVQCHGKITASHPTVPYGTPPSSTPLPTRSASRQWMETCAPCHARNELLDGAIRPGGRYVDQYRLTLPTDADIFYPDGQVKGEDYNYASLLLSPMWGEAGVTCLDCHDPHSGKVLLPVSDNQLCLSCHASGRLDAPIIRPTLHSHHTGNSAGNRCIACHMPSTVYMQRDARHDHGFLRPDPLLTEELGIPNACNKCHADKGVDWAIAATVHWYGDKMSSRQRVRARAVAAAQAHRPGAAAQLANLVETEDIPAWKASLLLLGEPYMSSYARLKNDAKIALSDGSAMVRAAAVKALDSDNGARKALTPLLRDRAKLVRVDAEWSLSPELAANSVERRELDSYLAESADQPAGQARIGEDLFNRGQIDEAVAHLRRAADWDPGSAPILWTLATMLNARGATTEAAQLLWRAATIEDSSADLAFQAGLSFAAAGDPEMAREALQVATQRDPTLDRAWYDLALVRSKLGDVAGALDAVHTAQKIAPNVADYSYAEATILLQLGERTAAISATRRTLEIDPANAAAQKLLGDIVKQRQ